MTVKTNDNILELKSREKVIILRYENREMQCKGL